MPKSFVAAGLCFAFITILVAAPPESATEPLPTPQWIWAPKDDTKQGPEVVLFRKEFRIKSAEGTALLFISGDDKLTVYFDGQEVASNDTWKKPLYKDISSFYKRTNDKKGSEEHVIAVVGRNQGGGAGVIVRLDLVPFRGATTSIVTDDTWRALPGKPQGDDWKKLDFDDTQWPMARVLAPLGGGSWKGVNEKTLTAGLKQRDPTATPITDMIVAKDFKVELLHSVNKETEGSWVSMCMDPKGRIIACDEYGGLYRLTLPKLGTSNGFHAEKIDVPIGEGQGLLWAFDSLYVNVNSRTGTYEPGLYRVRDTDGDDKLDKVESLRPLQGKGDHGPHAVLLAPDGKSLYIVNGNGTKFTDISDSRVPRHWGEDHLLPRMPDGRGFMRDVLAPGGCIYRIDPDGKNWELVANGFRNEYDAAFNRDGELFAYDADMEYDINTPWYRPTRVNHVISGAEFGWRNGAGKWPAFYADSFGAVVNVGPGSPTGVTFGYGAKFPVKYQEALFISDWSYGKIYAVHLTPDGSSYTGMLEPFVTGTPLPATDLVVNPNDGAMYFAIGGRKVQSGLYRVTYAGAESTAASQPGPDAGTELRALRHKLEALHRPDPSAVATAWPYLGHEDRGVRFAARTAIEHQPPAEWKQKALDEKNPRAAIYGLLALIRSTADCPQHHSPERPEAEPSLGAAILEALGKIDLAGLPYDDQLAYVRTHEVLFNRYGMPEEPARERAVARFDAVYPTKGRELNGELANVMAYLQAPSAAAKTVALLETAPTQEEQMEYARALRMLDAGWTDDLRETYFKWFLKAANYHGGASFVAFVANIKSDAVDRLADAQEAELKDILEATPESTVSASVAPPRPLVKEWKLDEVQALAQTGLHDRNFDRGRQLFAAANCFACHRFDNEGGAVGPDLSSLAGRFSARDIIESVVEPSKVISDQFAAITIVTTDGRTITGRIVNLSGDSVRVNTNMLDPHSMEGIDRKQIEEQYPSKLSMMPTGLLNTMHEDEILDLLAYLLSRGDRNNSMFSKDAPSVGR